MKYILLIILLPLNTTFAAVATCKDAAALLVLFKMKDTKFGEIKESAFESNPDSLCSNIDESSFEDIYTAAVKNCKSVILPDGKTGDIGDNPCTHDMVVGGSVCKVAEQDKEWKISDAGSIDDILGKNLGGEDGPCTGNLLKSKLSKIASQVSPKSFKKSCALLVEALQQVYKKEANCDIAPVGKDETKEVSTISDSSSCEIPDANGLCPGQEVSSPQKANSSGFVLMPETKAKKKRRAHKTSSFGSAVISQ